MADLVVRGGLVVDGTGAEPRPADVAITDGVVTEVGRVTEAATTVIDADGALVTPGFVDIHTHFDGQVTWDDLLTPTCWHGVTTVVMGNCGVGFAPVQPDRHDWLIGLMEGVEDIPGTALSDGIRWEWESYPEYLDAIARRRLSVDVGSLIPHGAVRGYVMGERGARNEAATDDDIEAMAAIVRAGMAAGAVGVSTSRTIAHMAIDGEPVPGTFAAEAELFGLGTAMAESGRGIFELAPAGVLGEDLAAPVSEMAWMRRLAAATGRPVTFALLQNDLDPEAWRSMLDLCTEAAAAGAAVHPQVAARPVNILLGLETFHPFSYCPSWPEIALLDLDAKVAAMADPDRRARLVAEAAGLDKMMMRFLDPERVFPVADLPDYEPPRGDSIAERARRNGVGPWDQYYDTLLEDGGKRLVMRPLLNYTDYNLDAVHEMLVHPTTTWGLGDGGAHCGTTCDASSVTYVLSHWARDRATGRLPLAAAVKTITSDTARLFGFTDRGTLEPGMVGDLNVIDFDALAIPRPELVHDLPAGARRFVQRANGYVATVKRGEVTFRDGVDQGPRPGGLVRLGR